MGAPPLDKVPPLFGGRGFPQILGPPKLATRGVLGPQQPSGGKILAGGPGCGAQGGIPRRGGILRETPPGGVEFRGQKPMSWGGGGGTPHQHN